MYFYPVLVYPTMVHLLEVTEKILSANGFQNVSIKAFQQVKNSH